MNHSAESRFISVNGLRLHYLESGRKTGRPMVLLHGTGDHAHVWDYFAPVFANYFRILSLDQRGHGQSARPRPPAYACEDYVGDLAGLFETLGLDQFVLVGHSMGALHAVAYTSNYPDKVAALIHADIEIYPPVWNRQYLHGLYETRPESFASLDDYARYTLKVSPYARPDVHAGLAPFGVKQGKDGRYYHRYDRELLKHFVQYDLRENLKAVKCPTLIIRGAESRVMRRKPAEEMNRMLPKSRFVEIPQATHPVHTDQPEAFNQAVIDFLKEWGLIE